MNASIHNKCTSAWLVCFYDFVVSGWAVVGTQMVSGLAVGVVPLVSGLIVASLVSGWTTDISSCAGWTVDVALLVLVGQLTLLYLFLTVGVYKNLNDNILNVN